MDNCFLFVWICCHLPLSEVGIIIFINCWVILWIAGGESGVPFRLQVDSYSPNSSTDALPMHSAGCQVKVFKVSSWPSVLWTCTVWQQQLKLTKMTMVTIVTVTSSSTTATIIIGTSFSFLLLILLSVYHGHVMMTMLISTLARQSHQSHWQLYSTPTTLSVASVIQSVLSWFILHLPWNDLLFSPKVQTGSSRLNCRNLNTKQMKSWWDI